MSATLEEVCKALNAMGFRAEIFAGVLKGTLPCMIVRADGVRGLAATVWPPRPPEADDFVWGDDFEHGVSAARGAQGVAQAIKETIDNNSKRKKAL